MNGTERLLVYVTVFFLVAAGAVVAALLLRQRCARCARPRLPPHERHQQKQLLIAQSVATPSFSAGIPV